MLLKKYCSVRMGVTHLSTGQKMLLMFMMRMTEIRNMCMVIDFCKSHLSQINCANGMNIVFAILLLEKFPILKAVGGFTIQNTIKTLLTLPIGGFSVLII